MDWFRFYGEFASDPKVQMMSEAMQRRLVMLFCLQCSNGIETFHETERDTSIAFALRISIDELSDTKEVFLRKGFINPDWELCNWGKRQYASDSSTARVREYRERKKLVVQQDETLQERSSNGLEQNRTEQIQTRTEDQEQQHAPQSKLEAKSAMKARRGTRLPDDWEPNETLVAWAQSECPAVDLRRATDEFRDYWRGVPGQRGCKLDWPATWRNRIREISNKPPTGGRHGSTQRFSESLTDRAARLGRAADERERNAQAKSPAPSGNAPSLGAHERDVRPSLG